MSTAMPYPASATPFAPLDRPRGGDDDPGLAFAIAAGDVAALDQLYRRYRPLAFAAAYALLHDPHAAEDAGARRLSQGLASGGVLSAGTRIAARLVADHRPQRGDRPPAHTAGRDSPRSDARAG